MIKEIWKDIPEYEGYYKISDLGRIMSIDRYIYQKNRWGDSIQKFFKSQILKQFKNHSGYLLITLQKNGKKKHHSIARLVLTTFVRPANLDELACHFPDSNKSNNKLTNLKWGTAHDNSMDVFDDAIRKNKKHFAAKLHHEDVKEILKLAKIKTKREIAKIFNVNESTVCNIIGKKRWKHISI